MRTPLKTSTWLMLINVLVFCAGFAAFLAISIHALSQAAAVQTENNLRTFARALKNYTQALDTFPENAEQTRIFVKNLAAADPLFRITVVAPDGTVIADSDTAYELLENHAQRTEIAAALAGGEAGAVRQSAVSGKTHVYYALPIPAADGTNYALRLSEPLEASVFFSASLRVYILAAACSVLAVILILSFVLSRRIISPLTELKNAAVHYRNRDFAYRPAVSSPSEFAELAETLGDMALTIRKNMADISKRRAYFESVFRRTGEALIVFDKNLRVREMNQAAQNLFDLESFSRGEELVSVLRNTQAFDYARRTATMHSASDEQELRLSLADGEHKNLLINCAPIGEDAQRERFLLMFSDITRLKRLEQVRKDFVANVSHELKTPVTAIKGFTENLLDGALDEKETARHFLTIIDRQTARLAKIIEDLLILSRLEQESFSVRTETVSVRALAEDVCAMLSREAEKKHISLLYDAETDISIEVNEGLFTQALENLAANAVKYCPEGSQVRIGAQKTESQVIITVDDDGPGIAEADRDRIFERFFRSDKGRSRENGGTGLGLSIVRHIVELHEGSVRTLSRTDTEGHVLKGSRFEIRLPLKAGDQTSSANTATF